MKTLTTFITILTVLNLGAAVAFADDMWRETPGLEDLKAPSVISEPSRLSNTPLTVDMWAETPTFDNNDNTAEFYHEKVVIKSGLANPELYTETPDQNKTSPVKMNRRLLDDVMVAEQDKREITKQ